MNENYDKIKEFVVENKYGITLTIIIIGIMFFVFLYKTKEITLSSNTSLYTFPAIHAKELLVLETGTTLSILRNWRVSESDSWIRVELKFNKLLNEPNKISKGWIKM